MSVADFPEPPPEDDDPGTRGDRSGYGDGPTRTPPQDITAEQSVLGGMMLSKDAIADVVEQIRANDFYRPAHELVYGVILDLYTRGEPADAVTVAAELTRRGEIAKVGGASYLHTLISSVPTAANAGYYARIVRERAILRRLVEAGTRIVQMGFTADGEVDDIVNDAQAEIYKVTEQRTSEDFLPLAEIMEGTLDEIESIGNRSGQMVGIPTGFADLDALTNGLHPGQMVVLAARPAVGKALALDTPLPTPTGWTTMGEVEVGETLLGADGTPTRVVAATDVMHDRPCYEITFSDGSAIVADAQHQWRTTTRASRRQRAENKLTHYWSAESLARVRAAYDAAAVEPDELITYQDAVAMVGEEFRDILHTVIHEIGSVGRVPRRVAGEFRSHLRNTQVYSRRELLRSLFERAGRTKNSATRVDHPEVITTEEIAGSLRCGPEGRLNHAVAVAGPIDLPERPLPLPPYTLGAWLGDGHTDAARITTADPEIIVRIEADGLRVQHAGGILYQMRLPDVPPTAERRCEVCGTTFTPRTSQVRTCGRSCGGRVRFLSAPVAPSACPDCGGPSSGLVRCQACHSHHGTVQAILRSVGVLGNKHIPTQYLRASETQRRALLAGLLDTDGYVNVKGTVQFAVTDARLAHDTHELVLSLGYRATMTTKPVRGRTAESSTCYMVTFTPPDKVFELPRKAARQSGSVRPSTECRYITDVRRVPSVPVRCVEVDSRDHMYLAGRTFIPTHNSTLGLDLARSCSIRHQLSSVIFSLEMGRNEITMRLLSAEARVALHHMRSGTMTDDDWNRLARRMGEVSSAPLFIDDSPNLSMMEIRAKCRRLKQREDLRLVIVDYLQLMQAGSSRRIESRQQEVSEMSRSLKLLAKELEVPVVAISQLNRGPEQRTDKRPMISDLRESGSIEQDADMVILLHREDAYERESPRAGEADLIVAKHRNGPTATITVAFQGHYSRFVDMAQN